MAISARTLHVRSKLSFNSEPALWIDLLGAVFSLALAFGLRLTVDQQGAIIAVTMGVSRPGHTAECRPCLPARPCSGAVVPAAPVVVPAPVSVPVSDSVAPQVGVSELSVSRRAIGLAALPLFEEEAAWRTGDDRRDARERRDRAC